MSYFCCLFGSDDGQGNLDERVTESGVADAIHEEKERLDKLNILEDEGEDYQRDLWRQVIAEKSELLARARNRLAARQSNAGEEQKTKVNGQAVQAELDDTYPDKFLQDLTTMYTSNGYAKRMPRVRQIFEGLRPFVVAVNTLVQTETVSALVWGSVCLVFESVLRFAKFWDDLRVMFDDLTRALPRFHGYIQVLHTPRLHAAMRSVYASFIDICMMTLDCLQSDQCFVLFRIQWTGFVSEFRKAMGDLSTANSEFEKEAQLAHVQEEAKRHVEVLAVLQKTTGLPMSEFKSNITMGRNAKFTGRDDTLTLLHSFLEPSLKGDLDTRPFRSCLIHAIGGMGKTETALEYTYRFGNYYLHKFWLKAQTKTSLQESFLDVVDQLGIVKDPRMQPSRKKEIGLEWFRTTEHPWLLVYDNAEDLATVHEFWPAGNGGAAIVTSQNPAFGHTTTHSIQLHPMPLSEGRALIQVYLGRGGSEKESAEHLSASLGGLPLAIVHFTGYIARSQCPIEHISKDLDQRLRTSTIWKLNRGTPANIGAYQHTLDTVWDLALQRLNDDARLLLDCIAFLDPDDIPVDLFIGDGGANEPSGAVDGRWEYWDMYKLFNEAIAILCERHLVTRTVQEGSDSLRTHRALQMCILQRLDADLPRRAERFEKVVAIVRRAVPVFNIVDRSDITQFPRFAKYFPQVFSVHRVFKNSEPAITGTLTFASILDDNSYYAYNQYNNIAALTFAETGESICSNFASDAAAQRMLPSLLTIISMIIHYRGIAGRERALAMIRRVVALREEEMGPIPRADWTDLQAVNYARAHVDLACELCESNRPGDAAPLLTKCIGIYTEMDNKFRLALVYIYELMVLSTAQKRAETRTQAEIALATVETMLGGDNPLGNLARFQVAMAYFTIGDVETAIRLVQAVFQQRLMMLGHANDLTLASQYCLAVCAQNTGQLDVAEGHLREVLANGGQVTEDWREEDVMRVKFRMAVVLRAKGGGEAEEEGEKMRREVARYLADKRPLEVGKEFTDADDMELLDVGVTLEHGRTAGIWSNGELW